MGKCGRAGQSTWRLRISCWIAKAADTLTICNACCLSTATVVARTHPNVTLYVHCSLSCYLMTEAVSFRLELKLLVPAFPDITSCLACVTVISTTSGSLASLGLFLLICLGYNFDRKENVLQNSSRH